MIHMFTSRMNRADSIPKILEVTFFCKKKQEKKQMKKEKSEFGKILVLKQNCNFTKKHS